jgi:hypothetical protein
MEQFDRLELRGQEAYVKGKPVRVDEVVSAMHQGQDAINAIRVAHGINLRTMLQCLRYRAVSSVRMS